MDHSHKWLVIGYWEHYGSDELDRFFNVICDCGAAGVVLILSDSEYDQYSHWDFKPLAFSENERVVIFDKCTAILNPETHKWYIKNNS
jgi:hypothetical protein